MAVRAGSRRARVPASLLAALIALACAWASVPARAAEQSAGVAEPQARIIVAREPGLSAAERIDLRRDAGARLVRTLDLPRTEVLTVPTDDAAAALRELNADPDVVYAERDVIYHALVEPLEGQLWGLPKVHAPEANATSTGAGVLAAVVDTGVDFNHQDAPAIATNPGETGGGRQSNGADDDGNGFVDDWRGWDWVGGDNVPQDANGHGSHVSGTLAAPRNSVGVVGVAPGALILPLRVLDAQGAGSASDIAEAFEYAGRRGIKIVNASLGGNTGSQTLDAAMRRYPETLFVVAAGNEAADNDSTPSYPCNAAVVNVICVGATDQNDGLAFFSNFGRRTVDLFAPGVGIISTVPPALDDTSDGLPSGYDSHDGTSMATPFVAGAAADVVGSNAGLSANAIKSKLLAGVDPIAGLAGRSVTGGRLNVRAAIDVAPPDADGDAVGDSWDDCPTAADPTQVDSDGDGLGDACDDGDGDGVPDSRDECPSIPVANSINGCTSGIDSDHDGIPDARDSCPAQAGGGSANGCPLPPTATDADGDGVPDASDRCPTSANATRTGCAKPRIRSLTARQLRCRRGSSRRRCVRVNVKTDRAGTVRVTVQIRRRGRYRTLTTRTIRVRRTSGGVTITLKTAGRYRLRGVATSSEGERSRTRLRGLSVR